METVNGALCWLYWHSPVTVKKSDFLLHEYILNFTQILHIWYIVPVLKVCNLLRQNQNFNKGQTTFRMRANNFLGMYVPEKGKLKAFIFHI